VRTGALAHVQVRLLVAYVVDGSCLPVNWNAEVHLYDGTSYSPTNVDTLTSNVSPILYVTPLMVVWLTSVEELLCSLPAAGSQLSDAEIAAPGVHLAAVDV